MKEGRPFGRPFFIHPSSFFGVLLRDGRYESLRVITIAVSGQAPRNSSDA